MSGKYPGGFVQVGAPAGYSVYFDGTNYLTVGSAGQAQLNLGTPSGTTNNFTLECWFYPTAALSASTYSSLFGCHDGVDASSYSVYVRSNGVFLYGAGNTFTGGGTVNASTWYHVAIVRSASVVTVYLNGVQVDSQTRAGDYNNTSDLFRIGDDNSAPNIPFAGYISNLRVAKGSSGALYTAAFTPPTQLFPVTNTQLLTCQSPTLIDNSANALSVTTSSSAVGPSTFTPFTGYTAGASGFRPALGAAAPGIWTLEEATYYQGNRLWPIYDPNFNQTTLMLHGNSPTNLPTWITDASTNNVAMTVNGDTKAASQTPFSLTTYPTSGSGFFDGTGDYLNSGITAIGTSNFTVEYWSYLTAHGGTNGEGGYFQISGTAGGLSSTYTVGVLATRSAPGAGSVLNVIVGGTTISTTHVLGLNTWFHTSIVRSSNSVSVYVNGTLVSTPTTVSTNLTGTFLAVGGYFSTAYLCNGYISNFRVTNTAIVPPAGGPTAPLTAVSGTSLLTLQNAQPTANSSFIDSSTNNFPITRFGNTTQGTFTPFSQTGWSNFLPAGSNVLAASTAATMGTADFCLEAWIYAPDASPAAAAFIVVNNSSGYQLYLQTQSNQARFLAYQNPGIGFNISGGTVSNNTWTHIVGTRQSSNIRVFINGMLVAYSASDTRDYGTASTIQIAGTIAEYVSNARVILGNGNIPSAYQTATTTLNTQIFTPPTAPLTSVTGTIFLSCQDNRFKDNSSYNSTFTVTGTPSIQTFSPFAPTAAYSTTTVGGSGYFDGASDSLSLPNNAAFAMSNGAFTIEFWFYTSSVSQTGYILQTDTAGTALYVSFSGSTLRLTDAGTVYVATPTLVANQWYHIAVVRSGTGTNQTVIYTNGVAGTAGTCSQTFTQTGPLIGAQSYLGYITSMRIVKGQALASGNFTPPTAPVTTSSVGWTGTNAASSITGTVSLLTNFTNAGIIDSTGDNVLETVGNAQISTVQSKWGGSSMVFNGTNSNLQLPSTPTFAMGGGDWTVEMWLYPNNVATLQGLLSFGVGAWRFFLNNSGLWFLNGASSIVQTAQSIVTTGQWYHVAVCRSGSSVRIFLNGTQIGSTGTDTSTYAAGIAYVGSEAAGSYLNGYIDDLRVTRGIARYTTTFTPPTSQLQSQ